MSALYQRARPVTFAELVGQEHVKDVLEAAVRDDRTSHAYLFSGPRGVGKTTTARLLAMAVNCEPAVRGASRPCGECESCRLVRSVTHPDVIELDAASNNSVDDVRDLQSHMGLASMRGGKRVWILDEAHMLSKAAANALLKTLEEPPPGLIFILATTEPEKLPPTILSRCQHFRFRRLADAEVTSKLARLCAEAGVEAEPDALALIARSADGGMRDAESLLDRLLVKGEALTRSAAESALGLPAQERLARMGTALLGADLDALLNEAGSLYRDGYAPRTIAEQLARAVRDELHRVLAGNPAWSGSERDTLLALLHALDDESERFVRQNDLYALEVALIKAQNVIVPPAVRSVAQPAQQVAVDASVAAPRAPTETRGAAPDAESVAVAPATPRETSVETTADVPTEAPVAPPFEPVKRREARAASEPSTQSAFSWHAVRTSASPQLKAFLAPAQVEVDGFDVTVRYDDKHSFHRNQLMNKLEEFKAHVAAKAGAEYRVTVAGGSSPKERGRTPPPARSTREDPAASRPASAATAPGTEPATSRAKPARAEVPVAESATETATEPDPTPAPQPAVAHPGDYVPTELELAGFDEDHAAWMDEPLTGAGDSFEEAVSPSGTGATRRGKGGDSLEQQALELLASSGAALGEVQQLFPGRVTHVVSAEAAAPRAAVGPLDDLGAADAADLVVDDGSEAASEDGDSYEDDSQDRLSFGP